MAGASGWNLSGVRERRFTSRWKKEAVRVKIKPDHPILLVEDSPEDYEATVRVLRKSGLANPIFRCVDGDDALDFLHHRGAYADPARAPRPSIILLDLNLPGTDGREVLTDIKRDEHLKLIPVIVLTTSRDERDISSC
ncbi:MAG: response regulator, partial [Planctomycetes bacterium]|nr:response regulator [Planctomycetota bacterium]